MGLMTDAPRLTKGQIFRYMFFPQILPRINAFAETGFVNLAFLMAQVYAAVGLLPRNHAIFLPGGRNNLSLRYVIACAAQNLKWSRSHIDQIIVFIAILVGLVLLALQFIMLLGFIAMKPAFAQGMPDQYGDFFFDSNETTDIAYRMLWTVFGVPELFKEGGARSEYHIALHSLFQLYSVGMLVIAVLIVCYFIFAVLAETAQTGVPFGKRYDHVWAPIRLVVALGLLIPVGYGLNSAQWITLYMAKFGSDFATKGWVLFNETMTEAYLKKPEERVGTPKVPDINNIPAFMMTAFACDHAYERLYGPKIDIKGYIVTTETIASKMPLSLSARVGKDTLGKGDILVVFGEYDPDADNRNSLGYVKPICGQMLIPMSDATEPGSAHMRDAYFALLYVMNYGMTDIKKHAQDMVDDYIDKGKNENPPPSDWKGNKINSIRSQVKGDIATAVLLQGRSESWENNIEQVKESGWGGAGMWYNKIAQINGSLISAVNTVPQVRKMPETMELIRREVLQQNRNVGDGYSSEALAEDLALQPANPIDGQIGSILVNVYNYWRADDRSQGALANQTKLTGNAVIDVINVVFGTQGLFAMCQNTDTHPLAQLSILGKGLVDASIRNVMGGAGLSIVQAILPGKFGAFMGAASGMLFSIASITIVLGFMLYYVLPFMPFLYFFFAVGGWIKGLFEAMVGMPLWALAHLRIDGEGLPGSAGLDGYYLIFEIFIRPILIVFGLLASVVIFAAMVKVLNEIFHLVVQNLSGHDPNATTMCGATPTSDAAGGSGGGTPAGEKDPMEYFRGPIDELFYTVLYAIIVYMIGMSCFKLIDLVPNNILRYMGSSANTFNDKAADPADGLMRNLSIGGSMVSGKVLGEGGIIQSAAGGSNSIVSGIVAKAMPPDQQQPG